MKIAVMQPYFLPYLGYFQLINAVDKFVFYDDVNFIKKGWINRNNFLLNGNPHLFTIPLKQASQNRKINTIQLSIDEKWVKSFFKTLEQAYKNAPYYNNVIELLIKIFDKKTLFISELAKLSIIETAQYLSIPTTFEFTSAIYNNVELKGSSRILDICRKENADTYINPIGGRELYDKKDFAETGIQLFFQKMKTVSYTQFEHDFVPSLSMLDVIMFNSPQQSLSLLSNFELL